MNFQNFPNEKGTEFSGLLQQSGKLIGRTFVRLEFNFSVTSRFKS